jgi:hypothetical protein
LSSSWRCANTDATEGVLGAQDFEVTLSDFAQPKPKEEDEGDIDFPVGDLGELLLLPLLLPLLLLLLLLLEGDVLIVLIGERIWGLLKTVVVIGVVFADVNGKCRESISEELATF